MDPERYTYVTVFIILFFIFTLLKKVYEQIRAEDIYELQLSKKKETKLEQLVPYNKGLFFFLNTFETLLVFTILSFNILMFGIYGAIILIPLFILKPAVQWLNNKYNKIIILISINYIYILYKPLVKWTKPTIVQQKISKEIIQNKIEIARQEDILDANEASMLFNLLSFKNKTIRDIMKTPRVHMKAISISSSLNEIKNVIRETPFSRFPVYKSNIDNIVGLLYVKDLYLFEQHEEVFRVDMIMKSSSDIIYVLENKNISDLFYEMKRSRTHMAIIIDEFGGTIGLITLEDILEIIVGDIDDEKDEHEEKFILEQGPNTMIVHAKIPLSILNEQFQLELDSENVDTLGGLIIQHLNDVPVKGEEIEFEDASFTILSSEKNRICLVKVTRKGG